MKIMLQGTMSGVGKSLLTAAFCRIFARDGYKVAPFKSQNMALNSGVDNLGREMGRAQIMQAKAAFAEPDARMNPVLLKPTGTMTSQVMVMGEDRGLMSAAKYHAYKKELIPQVLSAFNSLESEYDIIVIEGAGSCSEINLKENDIVNMGLARLVSSPVLLVGDIDRGGVFAQLLGCVEWMEEEEKQLLKGFIINRFRGDISLLSPGPEMLKERTGYPLLGVVPFVNEPFDDEDSMSERLTKKAAEGPIDALVIRLPMISNFTDFNCLESAGMSVRYADRALDFGRPDIIFIPGTKNTVGDLIWLKKRGLDRLIADAADEGIPVFGICGGMQMLGHYVDDEDGVEQTGKEKGLGLLDIVTRMGTKKQMTNVKGRLGELTGVLAPLTGESYEGYEIHMGISAFSDGNPLSDVVSCGNVYGTYIHGILDLMAPKLAALLSERKGIKAEGDDTPWNMRLEKSLDAIADAVRANVDMERVYDIMSSAK